MLLPKANKVRLSFPFGMGSESDVQIFPILSARVAGNTQVGIEKLADMLCEIIIKSKKQNTNLSIFACLSIDDKGGIVGGSASLLGFVSECRYNIKNGIKPICRVNFRSLSSARTQANQLERSEISPADRVRHVALLDWIDRYNEIEADLRDGIETLLTSPSIAKSGYLEDDTDMAQCLYCFIMLYKGAEIVPMDSSRTKLDLWCSHYPNFSFKISLTKEET